MFCPKCGSKIPDGSNFCTNCGARLDAAPATEAAPVADENAEAVKSGSIGSNTAEKKPGSNSVKSAPKMPNVNKNVIIAAAAGIVVLILVVLLIRTLIKPTINLNDYMEVSVSGYDTVGKATATFNYSDFEKDNSKYFEKKSNKKSKDDLEELVGGLSSTLWADNFADDCISGSLDKEEGLTNGDKVVYTWDCDDEKSLKEYGIKLKHKDITTTVEGLEEAETFDPFEGIEVTFSGIDGEGTISVSGNTSGNESDYLRYEFDKKENLSNGDEVTCTIKSGYGDDLSEVCLQYLKKVPSVTEKTYTVTGLTQYIKTSSDIPEDAMNKMLEESEKHFRRDLVDNWDKRNSLTSIEYVGYYFLAAPDKEDFEGKYTNRIYLVYRYEAHTDFSHNDDRYVGDNTFYWYTSFTDIAKDDTGKVDIDTDKMDDCKEQQKVDTGISGWWSTYSCKFPGYASIDDLYDGAIKYDTYDYTCEDKIDKTKVASADQKTTEKSSSSEDKAEEDADSEGCIFADSSDEKIDEAEIKALSDDDLQYAINELYARHGYIFNDKKYADYYNSLSWYKGTVKSGSFSESVFNDIEKSNLAAFKKERDKR